MVMIDRREYRIIVSDAYYYIVQEVATKNYYYVLLDEAMRDEAIGAAKQHGIQEIYRALLINYEEVDTAYRFKK